MMGKVWLVGAGPGDIGLMTLRGREVLSDAEVVVYDALVGESILGFIPDTAERIYAGKHSGHHTIPQAEINHILLEHALAGKRVVRLKGGDPFLFGRGGEELELLVRHEVPFEIVPGVPSALAVPAYNGIPVTHRDFCSSMHFVTGHMRADRSLNIDFDALAREGGTLVFLMGITALPDIMRGLINAGMNPDTPAAVLERGTTARQRRISATVATLQEACVRAEVRTPAIIIVGRVCALADNFDWASRRPLHGAKVVVTRPRTLASELSSLLRAQGAEVLEFPAIRTVPIEGALEKAIDRLSHGVYQWLVLTSPSAVQVFMSALMQRFDIRALSNVRIAVLGPGTQKALRKWHLNADFLPTQWNAQALGTQLCSICAEGDSILIPRSEIASVELVSALGEKSSLRVEDIAAYRTEYTTEAAPEVRAAIERGDIDLAVFTSASTVRGFINGLRDVDCSHVHAVCIGPQTAAQAEQCGLHATVAEQPTLSSLVEAAEKVAKQMKAVKQA
ncbi:MAG: uroporphyrinogen-III C-methyltransferase [Clostridia bacterium]|nr:uroporphyrinogen-III C-methyltransferase [Clostridia bacterium]